MNVPLNQLDPRSVAARFGALVRPTPHMDSGRAEVLVYHGVTEGRPVHLNTRFVSIARLRSDIKALRNIGGLRFVTLSEAMDPDVVGPKVALTFDDGYRGMLLTLLPLLEAEAVPACLFVTTIDAHARLPGQHRMLWADRIDLAAHLGHTPFVVGSETFCLDRRGTWRRKGDGYLLKSLCVERDVAFLDAVGQACSPAPSMRQYWELLTPDDLRVLSDHPLITLGAHGVTHANLPSLSPDGVQRELELGKSWLEDCIQKDVTAFAYPHGNYTAECVQAARHTGYQHQALMEYATVDDVQAPDLCRRIGIHPRCGSLVQRQVIANGGYGHEVYV